MKDSLTRRSLLKNTASLLAVSALHDAFPQASSGKRKRMRLGGPIFINSDDPGALAREHRRLGYRAAYVPKVELQDKDRLQAIVNEFAAQDVVLAEVGAWVNMLDPDAEKRRASDIAGPFRNTETAAAAYSQIVECAHEFPFSQI